MKNTRITLYALGIFAFAMGGLQAGDHKLEDFAFGEMLFGDEAQIKDLKGKVVVIDFWGVQCGPCIAKMPHLAEMDREYADKGLRLIGAEMQRSSASRIEPIITRSNVKFPIIKGCQNPIGVNRLPHMAVFDVEGKMVFSGYPGSESESIIKKELERVVGEASSSPAAKSAGDAG